MLHRALAVCVCVCLLGDMLIEQSDNNLPLLLCDTHLVCVSLSLKELPSLVRRSCRGLDSFTKNDDS